MQALLVTLIVLASQSDEIVRDGYGVPLVRASTVDRAYFQFGRAVAQDRLWQMEMSRRLTRGRLAEIFGPSRLASDKAVIAKGYTDDELEAQFSALPKTVRNAFSQYAAGVNAVIQDRTSDGTLPPGYSSNGFSPEPWTTLDSAAIAINLLQQFGTGGAGELRNYAMYLYLSGQSSKANVLDVIDDLAWQNDPAAVPTVDPQDDPLAQSHPVFIEPTRVQTEAHIALLPRTNLFELLPAIQFASNEQSDLVAEELSVAHRFGSYAVVVGRDRSATGYPLLMSAPQMGHFSPSVVHEIAIDSPSLRVAGIDVPGVPVVIVGYTPDIAWGITSGAADLEDIFFAPLVGDNEYQYGTETRSIIQYERVIKVKGEDSVTITVERTHHGPVILRSRIGNAIYSVQSSHRHRELAAIAALHKMYSAKTSIDVARLVPQIPTTFNLFYATVRGEIGYHYTGLVPFRAAGYDPRFPMPSTPETAWQGFVSTRSMPRVQNPSSGVIANWNNKPAAWWPNFDTPVWGAIFRNTVLLDVIDKARLGRRDLEMAAWTIARRDTSSNALFLADFRAVLDEQVARGETSELTRYLRSYDGWNVAGSAGALLYDESVKQLRKILFQQHVGTFLQANLFERILQPTVIRRAMRSETKYDYLAGRSPSDVVTEAMSSALSILKERHGDDPATWSYQPGSIRVPSGPPIPYINRGTYIQITELSPNPVARSVASPGVAESGDHSEDQTHLARAWTYKPMWGWARRT